jgi:hypothetical protein
VLGLTPYIRRVDVELHITGDGDNTLASLQSAYNTLGVQSTDTDVV